MNNNDNLTRSSANFTFKSNFYEACCAAVNIMAIYSARGGRDGGKIWKTSVFRHLVIRMQGLIQWNPLGVVPQPSSFYFC